MADPYAIFTTGLPAVAAPVVSTPQEGVDPYSVFTKGFAQPVSIVSAPSAAELSASKRINEFRTKPLEALVSDESFDPVSAYADPELTSDPDVKQKILDTYKARELSSMGFGNAVKDAIQLGGGAIKGIFGLSKALSEAAGGIAAEGSNVIEGLVHKNPDRVFSAAADLAAGIDTSVQGLVGLGRAALSNRHISSIPQTDLDWVARLQDKIDIRQKAREATEGKGTVAQGTGLAPQAELLGGGVIPENAQTVAPLLDPTLAIPIAAGAKIAETGAESAIGGAVRGAAERAGGVAATALEKTGNVAATVGKKLSEVKEAPLVGAGLELAGGATGVPVAGFLAGKFGPIALKKVGESLADTAAKIRGTVPPGPIMSGVKAVLDSDILGTAAKGAVAGLGLTGDPLALGFTGLNLLGADNPEQAGELLGGQAALGAGAAVLRTTGTELKDRADLQKYGFGNPTDSGNATELVPSPGYGISPLLDQAHADNIAQLPQWQQNRINAFREAVRPLGKQMYVLGGEDFGRSVADIVEQQAVSEGKVLTPEYLADLAQSAGSEGNARGVFADKFKVNGKTIDALFLNGNGAALGHEGMHLIDSLLSPETKKKLTDAVQKNLTPEELQAFSDNYLKLEKRFNPDATMTPEKLRSEIFAELGSVVLNGVPLDQVGTPKPLQRAIYQSILGLFSKLGYDTGKTDLGLRRDPFLVSMFDNAIRSELSSRNPALLPAKDVDFRNVDIGAKNGSGKNVRVTPSDQDKFQRQVVDADLAKASAAVDRNKAYGPAQKAAFIKLGGVIAQGGERPGPVEVEYNSVKTDKYQSGRGVRRAEQEAGYTKEALGSLPANVRETVQKVLIPERLEVRSGDNVQLVAKSLDKVIANAYLVTKDAADRGVASSVPYANSGGRLTDGGWQELVKDIQTYTQNQANGFAGNGKRVIQPAGYQGVIPKETPGFTPTALSDQKANFVNVLMALPPPKTTAAKGRTASGTPANVIARELAAANKKPILSSVTSNPTRSFFDKYGVEIAEFNPLRDQLARAGVKVRDLLEVTERVNLAHIESVKPRNDLDFSRPSTDLIRAGFMPDPEKAKRIGDQDVRDTAEEYAKTAGVPYEPYNGYAKLPEELGRSIADWYDKAPAADPAALPAYQALADQVVAQYNAAVAAGYTIEPWTGEGEPYKSSADMVRDVKENKHLFFFKTDNGFGKGGEQANNNPLLADAGNGLVVNDLFRAVHDLFGHAKEGYEFGPRGEYNAFLAHASMFTPEALPALGAETLSQNAWVNFGPHLRREDGSLPVRGDADFKAPNTRPFADQKVVAVPQELLDKALGNSGEIQYTIQRPQPHPSDSSKTIPGYVQIERRAANGRGEPLTEVEKVNLPIPNENLPTGQYTQKQVEEANAAEKTSANFQPNPDEPQHAASEPLEYAVGKKNYDLIHYSDKPATLKTIDPKFMKPRPGVESRMYRGENKSFFFVKGSEPRKGEDVQAHIGAKSNKYDAKVSGTRLYDMDKDPLDLWFAINPAKADAQLSKLGYSGFIVTTDKNRKFVAMYEPTKVTPRKEDGTKASFQPKGDDIILGETNPDGTVNPDTVGSNTTHERLGIRTGDSKLWRYNPKTKTAFWYADPSEEQRTGLSDYLDDYHGLKIEKTKVLNPGKITDNEYAESHEPDNFLNSKFMPTPEEIRGLEDEYEKLPEAKGGRYLSSDIARPIVPGYSRSTIGESHKVASQIVTNIFDERIHDPEIKSIVFAAGPAAAGKTTGLRLYPDADQNALVYDSVLGSDASIDRVREAVETEKSVTVLYTWAKFPQAIDRMITRSNVEARITPAADVAKGYRKSMENFLALADEYKGNNNVTFSVVDNSGAQKDVHVVDNPVQFLKDKLNETASTDKLTAEARNSPGLNKLDPDFKAFFLGEESSGPRGESDSRSEAKN